MLISWGLRVGAGLELSSRQSKRLFLENNLKAPVGVEGFLPKDWFAALVCVSRERKGPSRGAVQR